MSKLFKLLLGSHLVFCLPISATESDSHTQCIPTFSATLDEASSSKQQILRSYFGPNQLFALPAVKAKMLKSGIDGKQLISEVLVEFSPALLQSNDGVGAVKGLLEINKAAKGLGISVRDYLDLMKRSLPLASDPFIQQLTTQILDNLIPKYSALHAQPKRPIYRDFNLLPGIFLSPLYPLSIFYSQNLLGLVEGTAIGIGAVAQFASVAIYPVQRWLVLKAVDKRKLSNQRTQVYDDLRLLPDAELLSQLTQSPPPENVKSVTDLEFDTRLSRLVTLADSELPLLRLMLKNEDGMRQAEQLPRPGSSASVSDPAEKARYGFLFSLGMKAKKELSLAQSILKKMGAIKRIVIENDSVDLQSKFPPTAIESGDAIAYYLSSPNAFSKKAPSLSSVVILGPGKSPRTWLVASASAFRDALKFRNSLDLFELPEDSIEVPGNSKPMAPPNEQTSNESLSNSGLHQSSVLIPAEVKSLISEDPANQRRTLRSFLIQQSSPK